MNRFFEIFRARVPARPGPSAVLLSGWIVMMTNGPVATIGQTAPVDPSQPRDHLRTRPGYPEVRAKVIALFSARHRTPARAA